MTHYYNNIINKNSGSSKITETENGILIVYLSLTFLFIFQILCFKIVNIK